MASISNESGSLAAAIAAQIRLRRTQRGLSAAELARQAGLSKATVSALEAGQANPTVDTLDALAVALRIPLTDLLTRGTDPGPLLMRGTPMPDEGPARELLRRIGGGDSVEMWRLRLPPHTQVDGVAHAPGTTEILMVGSGTVTAGPTADPATLGPGDLLTFAGDQAHLYCSTDEPVEIVMLMASPTPV
ncbi:XRE family transcriptional regulator [Kineosporia sp. NBRC 101731]|uniref:helix-turn-helix domain-containing protein n=1 Tax=Kineosporia sp. NBRC 101731 TaxID=3032199 RepID=UPI0024A2EF50|nr:XRE family transcriptional regulator [Kineosporia sp. NBRC 101731]GLY30988.1 DNA-binding protein [Kineosporia sp. NBRC 101731]